MTQDQILLVKKSWRLFRQINPILVGGLFYEKLFADQPTLKRMFKSSIEEQSQKLVDMLSAIVMHLDNTDSLANEIDALPTRHIGYGVKPDHYKFVGDALLWTLKQGLGIDWNKDVEAAWTACYYYLATAMNGVSHYE